MLNHTGTTVIETSRLLLRRFEMDDAEAMYQRWTNDPDVTRYLRWTPHRNVSQTKDVLHQWLNSYNKESFYLWAITLKEDTKPIGAMGLFMVNESDQCGEVAYCIGKTYWGQGIVPEALKAVIRYGFNTVGFNRIEAYHAVKNPASGKVMEKAGMQFEGIARQKYRSAMGFEDSGMYAIVKEDIK